MLECLPWRMAAIHEILLSTLHWVCCWYGCACIKESNVLDHWKMTKTSVYTQGNGKAFPPVWVWTLTDSAESVHYSFLPLDIYGLKNVPLQRLLQLAKPASLFQLYLIITSPCSTVCNKDIELPGCYSPSIRELSLPNASFSVCSCLSFLPSLAVPVRAIPVAVQRCGNWVWPAVFSASLGLVWLLLFQCGVFPERFCVGILVPNVVLLVDNVGR